MTHVCEGIIQIWQLGTELWDETFNFEDNIGFLVLKMIVWKNDPCLWMNFSILTHLNRVMGQNIQFWR